MFTHHHTMMMCKNAVLSCIHDVLTCNHGKLSRHHNVITCNHGKLSRQICMNTGNLWKFARQISLKMGDQSVDTNENCVSSHHHLMNKRHQGVVAVNYCLMTKQIEKNSNKRSTFSDDYEVFKWNLLMNSLLKWKLANKLLMTAGSYGLIAWPFSFSTQHIIKFLILSLACTITRTATGTANCYWFSRLLICFIFSACEPHAHDEECFDELIAEPMLKSFPWVTSFI